MINDNDAIILTIDEADGRVIAAYQIQIQNVERLPRLPGTLQVRSDRMPMLAANERYLDMTSYHARKADSLDVTFRKDAPEFKQ